MINVAPRAIHGLSLCSGVGGIELGVRLALGPRYRAVAYVERDPFAAAVLVARMAESLLDQAPVWDDLTTFHGHAWRGGVDLVTGGFPCQPFSAAGRKRGLDDDRWLWPDIARILDEVQPSFAFFENVRPIVKRGLPIVLNDLAALGFDAEWSCLGASDIGAPHIRKRLWILAHRRSTGRPEVTSGAHGDESPDAGWPTPQADITDGDGQDVADAHGGGRCPGIGSNQEQTERAFSEWSCNHLANAAVGCIENQPEGDRSRFTVGSVTGTSDRVGPRCAAEGTRLDQRSPSLMEATLASGYLWPPRPDDHAAWAEVVEVGDPQPSVRRVADGLAHRLDRLHAIGNGVVPLVAATAFLGLARRAGLHRDEP